MSTVIKAENIGKKYIIGHQNQGNYIALRDVMANKSKKLIKGLINPSSIINNKTEKEEFWALKDISFEIKQGDRVGIIGRNGAGKSTLLKVLSRIVEPTTGSIGIKGRVASLLEVGTGFHPELTGRENIYLNGAILGMGKQEIKKKFDEIVDFAEVEKFLDTPVKRYSSGMYVRLAFAVAAHLEPEILIVDEVLAVGDAQFQKKCLGKMKQVGDEGRTILFVSHNLGLVKSLCNNSILLHNGNIAFEGNIEDGINAYCDLVGDLSKIQDLSVKKDRVGNGIGRFISIKIKKKDSEVSSIIIGDNFSVELEFELYEDVKNPEIGIMFGNQINDQIARAHTWESSPYTPNLSKGIHKVTCNIYDFPLLQGRYTISLWLGKPNECIDYIKDVLIVSVEETDIFRVGRIPKPDTCTCYFKHEWRF